MDYTRQLDIVPMEKLAATTVHLIGAGGIGSPAGIALAKMGVGEIAIWDNDRVEVHNLPNQFYTMENLGKPKVSSLIYLIRQLVGNGNVSGGINIIPHTIRVTAEDHKFLNGIIVAAVDSMASRKEIWAAAQRSLGVDFFIDARMGGQLLRLYSLNPHDPLAGEDYEEMLYSDEESLTLPCTAQSIIYTGLIVGGLIANAVKRFVAGEKAIFEVVLDLTSFTLQTR